MNPSHSLSHLKKEKENESSFLPYLPGQGRHAFSYYSSFLSAFTPIETGETTGLSSYRKCYSQIHRGSVSLAAISPSNPFSTSSPNQGRRTQLLLSRIGPMVLCPWLALATFTHFRDFQNSFQKYEYFRSMSLVRKEQGRR